MDRTAFRRQPQARVALSYLLLLPPGFGWFASTMKYLAASDKPPPAFTDWKVAIALSFWPARR